MLRQILNILLVPALGIRLADEAVTIVGSDLSALISGLPDEAKGSDAHHKSLADTIKFLTEEVRQHNLLLSQSDGNEKFFDCQSRSPSDSSMPFTFLPVYVGASGPNFDSLEFAGRCFDFRITYEQKGEKSFDLVVETSNQREFLCQDTLLLANTEVDTLQVFKREGSHVLTFKIVSPEMMTDVAFSGIKVFQFCFGIREEFLSLLSTIKMSISDIVSVYNPTLPVQEEAVKEFLEEGMNRSFQERETQEVSVPMDLIQSGDSFVMYRLDGLNTLIMYESGSYIAHLTMALWFDDELFVVESTDLYGVEGIQRTPYK